ncbi:MAG: winged helix-turn-helix domain-containing protein [Xenococcaceae cyanobacterium]
MSIRIVTPTPGLTTTQQIIRLIMANPQGLSAKEISHQLNRPISMIQICLKNLKSSRCIYSKTHQENKQLIYYSSFSRSKK